MSPILLRPIREQQEHDRIIRQLEARFRRRFDVGVNVGLREDVSVKSGSRVCYPDLVLTRTTGGRRLFGVVEVETAESVNHLEAMAEWSHFARIRGAFYLYVPAGFTDVAERLCAAGQINVSEVWAYYAIGTEAKFSMTYRSPRAIAAARANKTKAQAAKSTKKTTVRKATAKPSRKTAKPSTRKVSKSATTKKSKTAAAKTTVRRKAKTSVRTKVKTAASRARKTAKRKK